MRKIMLLAVLLGLVVFIMPTYVQAKPPLGKPPSGLPARVAALETAVAALQSAVAALEAQNAAQQAKIDALKADLSAETAARLAADASLATAVAALESTDADLMDKIDGLKTELDAEVLARTAGDDVLQASLAGETAERMSADNTLQTQIDNVEETLVCVSYDPGNQIFSFTDCDVEFFNGTRVGIIEATVDGLTIASEGDITLDAGEELNTIATNTNIDSFVKTTMDSTNSEIKASGTMTIIGGTIQLN
jgi:multidrug efflux pump subunit AcrA (membrane-fusion protein)